MLDQNWGGRSEGKGTFQNTGGGGLYGYGGQQSYGEQRSRGVAPRTYKKSDDRIHDDACEALMNDGLDCSNVDVSVQSGVVTLTGEVCNRSDKHRIEQIIASMSGVNDVENQLRLKKAESRSASFDNAGKHSSTTGSSNSSGGSSTYDSASSNAAGASTQSGQSKTGTDAASASPSSKKW